METFRVHILGCGSAQPTLRHYNASQVVEIRGKMFMVDCGEGTQTQLRRSRLRFTNINHVFISHLHGDHCFGLIGMISTFGMLDRTAPLYVHAPEELRPMLDAQLEMFCSRRNYEVVFCPVDTTQHQVIYDDRSLTVETIPLEHSMPCCGFLFKEKPTLPHIRRDMIDCYEIPLSQINNIKNGMDWTTPDGEVIPNGRLTTPPDPVRSYAYCSDTRYMPSLHNIVEGVTTLYHESTYGSEKEKNAAKYFHSTAAQAAMVARDAHVGKLVLGHYSSRYEDEKCLLEEAKAIFEKTILSNEMMVIDI